MKAGPKKTVCDCERRIPALLGLGGSVGWCTQSHTHPPTHPTTREGDGMDGMGSLGHDRHLDARTRSCLSSFALPPSSPCLFSSSPTTVPGPVEKELQKKCLSLGPRTCITAAAVISSAPFFFLPFLLTLVNGCPAWPLLYLRIPLAAHPVRSPASQKTDDLPTHPSTHPPCPILSSPVHSCPALSCSPPLSPKSPKTEYNSYSLSPSPSFETGRPFPT